MFNSTYHQSENIASSCHSVFLAASQLQLPPEPHHIHQSVLRCTLVSSSPVEPEAKRCFLLQCYFLLLLLSVLFVCEGE